MAATDDYRAGIAPADELAELLTPGWPASGQNSDVDEVDVAESPELPGADLSVVANPELRAEVVPRQRDEFVCARCHLIQHRGRIALDRDGELICGDCT